MKKIVLLFGVLLLIGMISALPSSYAAEKTGFIEMREVVLTCEPAKKAVEELRNAFEANRAVIQAKKEELKKLEDDMEKQQLVLKADAYKDKENAYQKKLRDYQLMVKDMSDEVQNREQELYRKMYPDVMKVVQVIGEKEKYTLILDLATVPVVYYNKENDLTKRVIEELNKTFKATKK